MCKINDTEQLLRSMSIEALNDMLPSVHTVNLLDNYECVHCGYTSYSSPASWESHLTACVCREYGLTKDEFLYELSHLSIDQLIEKYRRTKVYYTKQRIHFGVTLPRKLAIKRMSDGAKKRIANGVNVIGSTPDFYKKSNTTKRRKRARYITYDDLVSVTTFTEDTCKVCCRDLSGRRSNHQHNRNKCTYDGVDMHLLFNMYYDGCSEDELAKAFPTVRVGYHQYFFKELNRQVK